MTEPNLNQRVAENLAAHRDCTLRLQAALHDENTALLANDVEALERVTAVKAAASERLDQLSVALEHLRRAAGADNVATLLSRADAGNRFAVLWSEIVTLARSCVLANRDNAALLEARQGQIRNALRMLGGGNQDTYGRLGATPGIASRSLGSA